MGFFFHGGFFEFTFIIVFILVIGIFIVTAVRGIKEWSSNNNSPQLAVEAKIVSKRISTSHHHHSTAHGTGHATTSTSYYATFEVESGDRMEFHISGKEYGLLAEGDQGQLKFQGTRYLGFQRRI